MSLATFSQRGTNNKVHCFPDSIAKQIAIDLIKGDSAKVELAKTNILVNQLEEKSINAFIQNNKGVFIACGRLQENENKIGQIRFMAVDQNYQGKGLGKLIITSLEEKAKELKLNKIQLQARENAVSFYKNNGYVMIEKTFLLWDQIQHFLMEKNVI